MRHNKQQPLRRNIEFHVKQCGPLSRKRAEPRQPVRCRQDRKSHERLGLLDDIQLLLHDLLQEAFDVAEPLTDRLVKTRPARTGGAANGRRRNCTASRQSA